MRNNSWLFGIAALALSTHCFAHYLPDMPRPEAQVKAHALLDELSGSVNAPSPLYDADYILAPLGYDDRVFEFWKEVVEKSTVTGNAFRAAANIRHMVSDDDSARVGPFLLKLLEDKRSEFRKEAVCDLGLLRVPYKAAGFARYKSQWPNSITECSIETYGDNPWVVSSLIGIATTTTSFPIRLAAVKSLYELWTSYINGRYPRNAVLTKNKESIERALEILARDKDDEVAYHGVKFFLVYSKYLPTYRPDEFLLGFLNRKLSPNDPSHRKDLFVSIIVIATDEKSPTGQMGTVRAAIKDATSRGKLLDYWKGEISKMYPSMQQSYQYLLKRWESMLE